jgi:alpha-tubulin suppressor-like RCC1 family protein
MCPGFTQTLLLTDKGKIYYTGEEVTPDTSSSDTFILLKEIEHADYIAGVHRFILTINNGYLYGYGYFENVFDIEDGPEKLSNISNFTKIFVNNDSAYILDTNGNVYFIGRDNSFTWDEYMNRGISTNKLVLLSNVKNIIDMALGGDYGLLLDKFGQVHVFGKNRYGQLGIDTIKEGEIKILPDFNNVISITTTGLSSALLTSDGFVYIFGEINDDIIYKTPTLLSNLTDIIQITSNYIGYLFLDKKGNLYKYGFDDKLKATEGVNLLAELLNFNVFD